MTTKRFRPAVVLGLAVLASMATTSKGCFPPGCGLEQLIDLIGDVNVHVDIKNSSCCNYGIVGPGDGSPLANAVTSTASRQYTVPDGSTLTFRVYTLDPTPIFLKSGNCGKVTAKVKITKYAVTVHGDTDQTLSVVCHNFE